MNDHQLLRYSRHILLPEIDVTGQQSWLDAHALIVGAGGLGGPAAMFLAAAGVGRLTIADPDVVEASNLQRQIIHGQSALGQAKVVAAAARLADINSEVNVCQLPQRLEGAALEQAVAAADVVLDCSDNFSTRHAINAACVRYRRPLVSGAAVRFDGQVAVFDTRQAQSPCYHCLFPQIGEERDMPCALFGVFAPLVGIVGSMQAAEALKVLAAIGTTLCGRLLLLDALTMDWRSLRVPRDPACPICSARAKL